MNNLTAIENSSEKSSIKKTLPHNIEAEQQLIGAILLNNDIFDRVSSIVKSEHFFDHQLQVIDKFHSVLILIDHR